jgi:hypothetical protein
VAVLEACGLLSYAEEVVVTVTDVWWHRPWVRMTESILGHVAALIVGFVMMVVGLALGVTIVLLPVGIVIGFLGVAIFIGGLFARINQKA